MQKPKIPTLTSFDEWITWAADQRVERDEHTWRLGYVAQLLCRDNHTGGRPTPNAFTVPKLAALLSEEPGPVGEWRNNYFFWKDRFGDIPDNASWRQCADCRRRSGWRPGMEVTPQHLDRAVSFLVGEVDNDRLLSQSKDPRPIWQRRLERAAGILAECVDDPEMPDALRALVRRVLAYVRDRSASSRVTA